MSARSGQLIPTKISNASLVEKLQEWGFTRTRTKGDFIVMRHSDKREVVVMAPHLHRGNSTAELQAVYRTVCKGDAAAFWSFVPPSKAAAGDPAPAPDSDPDSDPESLEKRNTAMLRGLASCVLEYVQSKPHDTHTIKTVAAAIKVVPGPVGNAMSYLHSQGHLVRVLRGTYRLSPTLQAESTVHHQHTGPVGVEVRGAPAVPAAPPVVACDARNRLGFRCTLPVGHNGHHGGQGAVWAGEHTAPEQPAPAAPPAPAPAPAPARSDEDDLDALLELVLPKDYQFQPSHIRAMREWQTATAKLLKTLRGES